MSAGELKFFDTDIAEITTATAGTILPATDASLVLMQTGTGESGRVGRKVLLTNDAS